MTPNEILSISNFLQDYIGSALPTYDGSTFDEWTISDQEFFINEVCYVVNAAINKYYNIETAPHEHFGTPCFETYASSAFTTIDFITLIRLDEDGNTTTLDVPKRLIEKQLS